ncbi:effector-associated domain EAD1-containing protein [Streptomyces sp. NBC_01451]|uniref:effector-associated domain EAD1-containing protein n=1 Tax=Streptomyces sp. NBC_01451 TaxID=2903872 RepID=UPI002E31C079|nr:effector-associated domain EAD1-containing protein [Streptomyces sp. NBC_01451]
MAGFTDGELQGLAQRYNEPRKARQLLGRAGYPKDRVPEFMDASSFWYEINQEIDSGVMTDGRDRILASDGALYPARPIGSSSGSGQNPPPNPQPPPGPGSSLTPNQVAIAGAVIAGLAVVIAAVVTGLFGLIDDDDPKGDSKGSKTTTSTPGTAGGSLGTTPTVSSSPLKGKTFEEQAGSRGARTYKDPTRLSITGTNVGAWQKVDVVCRRYAPSMDSVLPDGYWYLIASKPWSSQYYAPANSFMNGDKPGESNHSTDFNVPECN